VIEVLRAGRRESQVDFHHHQDQIKSIQGQM
jgi:hypothetical protein